MWHAANSADGLVPATVGSHVALRALVLVPLGLHALLGLLLISRSRLSRLNVRRDPSGENWTYLLQRLTAVAALAFLLLHAVDIAWPVAQGSLLRPDAYRAMAARLASTRAGVPWWALGYMLGMGACSYHFAAGLHGALRSWGLVTTRHGLRRAGMACASLGFATLLLGANTTVFLATGSAVDWPWAPSQAEERSASGVACPNATGRPAASATSTPTGAAGPPRKSPPRPSPAVIVE
jgi:succinate dehydrogenase/fumarate reductase cytochrome b subunit